MLNIFMVSCADRGTQCGLSSTGREWLCTACAIKRIAALKARVKELEAEKSRLVVGIGLDGPLHPECKTVCSNNRIPVGDSTRFCVSCLRNPARRSAVCEDWFRAAFPAKKASGE